MSLKLQDKSIYTLCYSQIACICQATSQHTFNMLLYTLTNHFIISLYLCSNANLMFSGGIKIYLHGSFVANSVLAGIPANAMESTYFLIYLHNQSDLNHIIHDKTNLSSRK